MSDERRTLTLKRRAPATDSPDKPIAPVRLRRKQVVVAKSGRHKLRKQQRAEKEKAAAVSLTQPVVETRAPEKVSSPHRPPRKPRRVSLAYAVATLAPLWPVLFDGECCRLLKVGIYDEMVADIQRRQLALSGKVLRRCLGAVVTSGDYLRATVPGALRYGLNGAVAGSVTEEEAGYAAERLKSASMSLLMAATEK